MPNSTYKCMLQLNDNRTFLCEASANLYPPAKTPANTRYWVKKPGFFYKPNGGWNWPGNLRPFSSEDEWHSTHHATVICHLSLCWKMNWKIKCRRQRYCQLPRRFPMFTTALAVYFWHPEHDKIWRDQKKIFQVYWLWEWSPLPFNSSQFFLLFVHVNSIENSFSFTMVTWKKQAPAPIKPEYMNPGNKQTTNEDETITSKTT